MAVVDRADEPDEMEGGTPFEREMVWQLAQMRRQLAHVTAEFHQLQERLGLYGDNIWAHEEALQEIGWNPAKREWKRATA